MNKNIVLIFLMVVFSGKIFALSDEESLIEAAEEGNINTVRKLLKKGVDPNAQDDGGKTALWWAASKIDKPDENKSYSDVVKYLLEKGADPNRPEKSYNITPLMIAAWSGDEKSLQALVDHLDIKLDSVDNGGDTVLNYVGNQKQKKDILIKAEAKTAEELKTQKKPLPVPLIRKKLLNELNQEIAKLSTALQSLYSTLS